MKRFPDKITDSYGIRYPYYAGSINYLQNVICCIEHRSSLPESQVPNEPDKDVKIFKQWKDF